MLSFSITCEVKRRQWDVAFRIYQSKASMLRGARRRHHSATNWGLAKTRAACVWIDDDDARTIHSAVFLNAHDMGSGVVAHEIGHAIFHMMRVAYRSTWAESRQLQECACGHMGELNRLFWKCWYDFKDAPADA